MYVEYTQTLLGLAPLNLMFVEWPNMGSGRYSLGADTEPLDIVRYWCQAGLVPDSFLGLA